MIARNIPSGLGRRFAFENLSNFDTRQWQALCAAGRAQQTPKAPCAIYGSDIHEAALQAARANLKAAGLVDTVALKQADLLDVKPPAREGMLVTNPPYGVRLSDKAQLAAFYPRLGDSLKRHFAGWRAYLFTADLRLPKLIGLAYSFEQGTKVRHAPKFLETLGTHDFVPRGSGKPSRPGGGESASAGTGRRPPRQRPPGL